MPRYVVLYRFTAEGAKNIRDTVQRARQTREQTEKRGFKVQTLLWTQGPYDLVSIIDAPSEEAMMGAMANVVAAGNVSSTTMRAFDDKEMEGFSSRLSTTRRISSEAAAGPRARARQVRRRAVRARVRPYRRQCLPPSPPLVDRGRSADLGQDRECLARVFLLAGHDGGHARRSGQHP